MGRRNSRARHRRAGARHVGLDGLAEVGWAKQLFRYSAILDAAEANPPGCVSVRAASFGEELARGPLDSPAALAIIAPSRELLIPPSRSGPSGFTPQGARRPASYRDVLVMPSWGSG